MMDRNWSSQTKIDYDRADVEDLEAQKSSCKCLTSQRKAKSWERKAAKINAMVPHEKILQMCNRLQEDKEKAECWAATVND